MIRHRCTVIVLLAFAGIRATAQNPTGQNGGRFDVAVIRLNTAGGEVSAIAPRQGGYLRVENQPLRTLIRRAYRVQDFQITGGPGWINSDRYDIEAKVSGNPPAAELTGPMLRTLLEDRFQLRVHRIQKNMSGYVLTHDAKGLKITASLANCDHGDECGHMKIGRNSIVATAIRMSDLVDTVGNILGRTVVDKTGFADRFDAHVDYAVNDPSDTGGEGRLPSLTTALRAQLGLRLESMKVPVEILVVDSVARPSVN